MNGKVTYKAALLKRERTKKSIESHIEKIETLKGELIALRKAHRENEKLILSLQKEELQQIILTKWLKDGNMTDSQILKLVELGNKIYDKIDSVDANEVVKMVEEMYGQQPKPTAENSESRESREEVSSSDGLSEKKEIVERSDRGANYGY